MSNFDCNLSISGLLQSYKPSIVKYLKGMEQDGNAPALNNNELSLFLPQMINDTIEFSSSASDDEIREYSENFDDIINEKLDAADQNNQPALGVGSFYGLNTLRTIRNDEVGSKAYEDLYGGQMASYNDSVSALNRIGIDIENDGYEAQFTNSGNGDEQFAVFVKQNIDGSTEFLKVLNSASAEEGQQIIQTIVPAGEEYGITNVYDYSYLKDNYDNTDTIENNIKRNSFAEINELASNALTQEARVEAYSKFHKETQEWKLTNSEIADEFKNKFMISIEAGQQKALDALQQKLELAGSEEERNSIQNEINNLNADNMMELNQYNLLLFKYESQLPDDIKNELYNHYTELSSAATIEERDTIAAQIQSIIDNTEMSKEEKALNYEQLGNCVFSVQNYEILSSLSILQNCDDPELAAELNDNFNQETLNLNKEMFKYQMMYNFANSDLPSSVAAELQDLYSKLSEAESSNERAQIISEIRETEESNKSGLNYSLSPAEMVVQAVELSQAKNLNAVLDKEDEFTNMVNANAAELEEIYGYYSEE